MRVRNEECDLAISLQRIEKARFSKALGADKKTQLRASLKPEASSCKRDLFGRHARVQSSAKTAKVQAAQQADTGDALQHSLSAATSATIEPSHSAAADPRDERFARALVVDLQLCDERFARAFPE